MESWPNAYGIGITIGALYKLNHYMTIGASYRSPIFFTRLTWQETAESVPNPKTGGISASGGPGEYSMLLNYPQQVALGIALHPIKRLLISLQGQWINWHSTLNSISISGPWRRTNSVSIPTNWKNSWVGSIGVQYALLRWLKVRTGYAYGSSPISKGNLYPNLLAPAIVTNQVSIGATEDLNHHWQFVEAYMHAFKNTVNGIISGTAVAINTSLAEDAIGFQINYLF